MEDAVARKEEALEHVPWASQFPSSLIYALPLPFCSGTKPTQYTIIMLMFVVTLSLAYNN